MIYRQKPLSVFDIFVLSAEIIVILLTKGDLGRILQPY